jgi:hypothetical protein
MFHLFSVSQPNLNRSIKVISSTPYSEAQH